MQSESFELWDMQKSETKNIGDNSSTIKRDIDALKELVYLIEKAQEKQDNG